MGTIEPSQLNQLQTFHPPCSKCGARTVLSSIEPAPEPDHDLRTFACSVCGLAETMKVKFR
jgi:hypothetical protein